MFNAFVLVFFYVSYVCEIYAHVYASSLYKIGLLITVFIVENGFWVLLQNTNILSF